MCAHKLTWCSWACFTCNPLIMLFPHKLSHTWQSPSLGRFEYGTTCAGMTWSWDYLWGELMKIGATCAGTTCVLGVLVTGSLWTLGRLVRGQHVFWEYLSQGGHEHWGELSKGTVVQGRFKVVSSSVHFKKDGIGVAWITCVCPDTNWNTVPSRDEITVIWWLKIRFSYFSQEVKEKLRHVL